MYIMTTVELFCILAICKLHTVVATTGGKPNSHWNDNQRQLNVLMLTIQASGHTAIPLALGEELVQRGHNVTLCMSGDKYQAAAEEIGLKYKSNGPPNDIGQSQNVQSAMNQGGIIMNFKMMLELKEFSKKETQKFFKMFKEDMKWDVIIAADFLSVLLPCLSELQKVPVITLHNGAQYYPHTHPPWSFRTFGANTDDMTFRDRFVYKIQMIIATKLSSYLFNSAVGVDQRESYCPGEANNNLLTAFGTRIPDIVPTAIGVEFSRTISPLTHYVGPILTKNPKPCSRELETWLNSKADNSVIYISMGSLTSVSKEMADAFIEGIKRTSYSILWAVRKSGDFKLDIESGRIYTDEWLPQLAILRHRAVSVAIMHGGANGLHESLHSGVPLILVPGITEQVQNAVRVHHHRLGIHLNRDGLTAEQVYQSILEIDSGDYRQNVAKIQKVFRQAGGVKRAADLVEFYSEVGYDHLIPAYAKYQWSWVQYYNVDVYSLLLLLALITVYVDYRILKCICSRCCCSAHKQKTD